jgi:hypothetical protein
MKSQYGFIHSAQPHVKRKRFKYGQTISMRFCWKTKCEVKQNTTVARSLILDSLPLLNPVIRHLSIDPSESCRPASGRQLFQAIVTVPKLQEALTLAKRRFIEYKMVRNDINIIADSNLHERTPYIIRDKNRLHVMENAPNERRGGIITVHRKLGSHPLFEDTKKTEVKGLKDIYGMEWESQNLDSMGGKFL